MIATLLWIVGMFIGCSLIYSVSEIIVHSLFYQKARTILGVSYIENTPVDPVMYHLPIAGTRVSGIVSRTTVEPLNQAVRTLGSGLMNAGLIAGILSVVFVYLVVTVLSPVSILPYWFLFFLWLSGFTNIGNRGIQAGHKKFGEAKALLNQIYVVGFTGASFIAAAVVLVLRYVELL